MSNLLPSSLPVATASILAGISPTTFARHVAPLLETDERGWIITRSLEVNLDRLITAEQYLLAERKRDKARKYQRNYRKQNREQGSGPGVFA
jgi:hypothetical protein